MKGALSSKPNYQFDAEGHLAKAAEDEPDDVTFLRESICLYVEGQSGNHPADVAASNDPAGEIPAAALDVSGTRHVYTEAEVEENDMEEVEEDESGTPTKTKRGRRGR